MPIRNSASHVEGAGLEQRVLHPGDLLLHGLQRLENHGRAHALGAQVAYLPQLDQVVEGEVFGFRSEARLLPARQLLGGDVQDAKNVRSSVAIHTGSESPMSL